MIQWNEEQRLFEMRDESEEERARYETAAYWAEWVQQQLAWLDAENEDHTERTRSRRAKPILDPIRHGHRETHIVAEPVLV